MVYNEVATIDVIDLAYAQLPESALLRQVFIWAKLHDEIKKIDNIEHYARTRKENKNNIKKHGFKLIRSVLLRMQEISNMLYQRYKCGELCSDEYTECVAVFRRWRDKYTMRYLSYSFLCCQEAAMKGKDVRRQQ